MPFLAGSSGQDDHVRAGAGNDTIRSNFGNDRVDAGDSDDSADGGKGDDSMFGDAGNDSLDGGDGTDSLFCGDRADTLRGGAGADSLTGGRGSDLFHLVSAAGGDSVTDFDMEILAGLTTDQLDVSDLVTLDETPVKVWDVTISDDGQGYASLSFPGGKALCCRGSARPRFRPPAGWLRWACLVLHPAPGS